MDLNRRAVITVLILPLTGLDSANYNGHHAFREPLRNKLSLLPPCNTVNEVGLTFAVDTSSIAIDRKAKRADSRVTLGVAQLRVSGQASN